MPDQDLTVETLKEAIHYDPETGDFFNRKPRNLNGSAPAGAPAGCYQRGYRVIKIGKKKYSAHRLAWLYIYGHFPAGDIDHINGDRGDNRISNLREASRAQNCRNAKRTAGASGVVGVHPLRGKFRAKIRFQKKYYSLGMFDSLEEAAAAYREAQERLHGEFSFLASRT